MNIYLGALIIVMNNKVPIVVYLLLSLFQAWVKRKRCRIGQTQFTQKFMNNVLPDLSGEIQDKLCQKNWEFRPTQ